ncbi:MAG: NAD(+)/NADH kinase [Proteobacteria bacterium]|nr:NAD(+)/NADH kinase [Pseudomonadota bacterium]
MKFGLLVKKSRKAKVFSEKLINWLNKKRINSKVIVPESEDLRDLDVIVVIGGDGTLLYASRLLKGAKKPIIGINMGGLGFLTEIAPDEAFDSIECFLSNRCSISERMMCDVKLVRRGKLIKSACVLNDAVITKGNLARMIELETYVNDNFLSKYRADGLIVSTPTGSTAYVLSAGGPIITPDVDCVIICPICPHTLTHRPIVISSNSKIEVIIKSETDVYLTLDGQEGSPLLKNDKIVISKSNKKTYIVNSPYKNYFEILTNKLHWGER